MRVLSVLLSFALVYSTTPMPCPAAGLDRILAPARGEEPRGVHILQLTPEQYLRLRTTLPHAGCLQFAQVAGEGVPAAPPGSADREARDARERGPPVAAETNTLEGASAPATTPAASVQPAGADHAIADFIVQIANTDWGGDADVVMFVVLGVVVAIAFVAYAGVYLYEVATSPEDIAYWWDINVHTLWLASASEHGFLGGLRFCCGFVERGAHAGMVLEAGYLDLVIDLDDGTAGDFAGSYVVAGPHVRWLLGGCPANPSDLFLELLAGWCSREEVNVPILVSLGFNLGLGRHGRVGFSIGALYLDLDTADGPIREGDDFSLLLGAEFGLRL